MIEDKLGIEEDSWSVRHIRALETQVATLENKLEKILQKLGV